MNIVISAPVIKIINKYNIIAMKSETTNHGNLMFRINIFVFLGCYLPMQLLLKSYQTCTMLDNYTAPVIHVLS